jgi:hypothetical protein
LFDPALKFRVLRTEHFRIYFHQGEDRLAMRLSAIAEDAWRALERPLGVRPPRLTHVVIADQTEQANGYATPLPFDTIVIYPTWPRGAEFATDDWLRLVITHEFTHIVHLDRSESWARIVRNIFGRTVIAFPNLFLPTWQIEGLATYEESAITGEGRLHAGDFRVIVEEATRQNALEPLDRVNSGLTDWPAGQAPYAYGVGFHQYLADRFGAEKLAELANATARRVPYTAPPVFRRVFGASLGSLWSDYQHALTAAVGPPALDAGITQLTRHGFVAGGPRFDRASGGIVYSKRTPNAFPSLERIGSDGSTKTLATRYFGLTTGLARTAIYFDQFEYERNVALLADLYRLDRASGRVERTTRGARLRDPDVSPDGASIAAVRESVGHRDLVTLDLTGTVAANTNIAVLVSSPDIQFNSPRWSPDGSQIVAERHRLGFDPDIVIVDVRTNELRVVAAAADTRIVMPTWRPDGRAIVAALAKGDQVFNLYEFSLDESGVARQLTHTTSGATWPDRVGGWHDDRVCRLHHRRLRSVFDAVSGRAVARANARRRAFRIKRHAGFGAGFVALDDLFTAGHAAADLVVASRRREQRSGSPRRRGFRKRRARLPRVHGVGNLVGRVDGRCANARRRIARLVRFVRLRSMAADAIRHGVAGDVVLRWTRNRPRDAVGRNSP